MLSMIQERKGQKKEIKNEEAMDDIKAMIRNFKNSRAGQKENMTANHYEDSQEYKYK